MLEIAEKVGAEIAKRGGVVICGGLGGVMEAACRGAKKQGGMTIGVIPYKEPDRANEFVDLVIATGMGEARNAVIVNSADGLIAISGQFGTLSEIAFALAFDKPIVGISTWDIDKKMQKVEDPVEAVDLILRKIAQRQRS
jgi:hypothetical protein